MRSVALLATAMVLGLASASLVACGDRSSLIPKDDASAMISDLDQAAADVAAEECRAAQSDVLRARARAARLPLEVDAELRSNLEEGLDHMLGRVVTECGKQRTTPTTTQATQTTPTQETTTQTVPTATEAPSPTPTPTQPSSPGGSGGTPPGNGSGNGGGNGRGNSGGSGED